MQNVAPSSTLACAPSAPRIDVSQTGVPSVPSKRSQKRKRAPRGIPVSPDHSFDHGFSTHEETQLKLLLIGDPGRDYDGIVCSWSWADHCIQKMAAGFAPRKKQFAAVYRSLFLSGIYPPADIDGKKRRPTLMRTCPNCGRDCPPTPIDAVDNYPGPPDKPDFKPKPGVDYRPRHGRANGMCVDCRSDLGAPPPPRPEAHFRRAVFDRFEMTDGANLFHVFEVLVPPEEFKAILSREERKERELRESESIEQLQREIAEEYERQKIAAAAAAESK